MTRGITSEVITAVSGEVVTRTIAVELAFASGAVRLNGSPANISIGGNEFLGVGGLGAISTVQEDTELRSYDLTVSLSGIPRDMVATALAEPYQNLPGTVWEVVLNPDTWRPINTPILIFRGRMQVMTVSLGQSATVAIVLENRLADWERPRVRRYTDEDQRTVAPSDNGLRFVAATAEKQLIWPAASWWDRPR
jgi:hypothetical protein